MKKVILLYRCSSCGATVQLPSSMPYKHLKALMDSYIYDRDPPPSSVGYTLNDYTEHECKNNTVDIPGYGYVCFPDNMVETVGIAKLVGYITTEAPDGDQNDNPHSHLTMVKG